MFRNISYFTTRQIPKLTKKKFETQNIIKDTQKKNKIIKKKSYNNNFPVNISTINDWETNNNKDIFLL